MNGVAAIKLTWIISIADTLAILTYFMYCDNLPFAGINHNYLGAIVPTPATTLVLHNYVTRFAVVTP